ncbi:MAG: glycosyltransferase [Oscillatoriaceae cyanobacterium Prado104]|jgi:glycosyltransferase involved in cell wall biosynthesis|nr:glycosyltransferase [Oscillatoriaceae cyanobacterium Prado104]
MSNPQISAIICTHNRHTYLGAAIDSLLVQNFPDNFEVVVVDNGSSDFAGPDSSISQTREVVEARLSDSRLKYVWEPEIGLSVARNTGARVARSEILAYLDDDAVADPNWLRVLHIAYQSERKLAVAGGKVELLWPEGVAPPNWLSPGLIQNLGAYNLGETQICVTAAGLTPRGVNYSIRRAFLEEIGGFDVKLGRIGKKLLSNEELRATELALELGWQVVYLPEALVFHNVAPSRLNKAWFVERGWWQGISECYREQLSDRADISQLWRGGERMLRGVAKSFKYFRDPAQRFENLVFAWGQIGYLSAAVGGLIFAPKLTRRL